MKYLLTLFVFTFVTVSAYAQTWQWAKRMGGDSVQAGLLPSNLVYDLAVDAHLNTYALSAVASKLLDVDGHPLTGYGKDDILLSSFDCAGKYRWSKVIGSSSDSDVLVALKLDNSGGVYVSGSMNLTASSGVTGAHIDADTFIGNTNKMMFLAKFDTSGNYQWFRMPQPDTISHYNALNKSLLVDMDFDGQNMCMMAWVTKGLYGGTIDVPTTGAYILKYDQTGVLRAAIPLPITLGTTNPILLAQSGIRYNKVTQQFIVSGFTANASDITAIGSTSMPRLIGYVAGFGASTGALKFLTYQKGTPRAQGRFFRRCAVDDQGNVYVGGIYYDSTEIGGQKLYNGYYPTTPGLFPASPIVLKLNGSTGAVIWANNGQAYGYTLVTGLAVVGNQVYAGGYFYDKVVFGSDSVVQHPLTNQGGFLLRLDPINGSLLQLDSLQYHNGSTRILASMTPFGKYSFICGGAFQGTFGLGTTVLQQNLKGVYPHSYSDAVIAKYGYPDCQNCSETPATFTSTYLSGNSFQYRFTGSIVAVDSIRWVWGDGKQQTVKSNFTNKLSHTFPGKGAYSVCITVYAVACSVKQYCNTSKLSVGTSVVNELKIYPNPTTGIINLEGLEIGAELDLQSIVGQSVQRQKVTQEKQTISLENLPQGTYLLRVIFKNGTSSFAKVERW